MKFTVKDVIYIILICVICFFGYRIWSDLANTLQEQQIAFKSVTESLARAENRMVTKTQLDIWAKQNGLDMEKIKKDLNNINGRLQAVGVTVASIDEKVKKNQLSDNTETTDKPDQPNICELCDIHSYTIKKETKNFLLDGFPIGRCIFQAAKKKPWTVFQDSIDIQVKTTLSSLKNGLYIFHHEIGLINKSRPELSNKIFKLRITSSTFRQIKKTFKSFFWWAPAIDLSIDNQLILTKNISYRAGASLGFSFLAYGYDKIDNDWRFGRFGFGFNTDKNLFISLEPARYNIGKILPIINDLWLGIGVVYDTLWGATITIGTNL